jgi:hypothetical protein
MSKERIVREYKTIEQENKKLKNEIIYYKKRYIEILKRIEEDQNFDNFDNLMRESLKKNIEDDLLLKEVERLEKELEFVRNFYSNQMPKNFFQKLRYLFFK